ncbi:CLUMA_CG016268, isoform A [Clunio marinus]|uniref:CLUMA_CG016268, isoform A n=1 Tax=Clunio marinus TaxID=568069 RepID=A0A1J1ISN2_9DIPT|nr:CLUMA_CG016268, isoform A [Clunio marinus]
MDLNLNNLNKMEISLEKFGTICAWILLSISLYSTISIVQLMNLIFFNGIPKNGEESVIFGVIGIFGGFVAFTKSSIISYQAIDGIKKAVELGDEKKVVFMATASV